MQQHQPPARSLVILTTLLIVANVVCFVDIARAATNITGSPTGDHYAWNDLIGWIDWYNTNTITVSSQQLTGYASSTAGEISLDCATSPAGNICGTSNYKIYNDGLGTLTGYAWNDSYGWISFNCLNHGCATSTYGIAISPTTGAWTNYAWNDILGWISVNCADISACGTSDYKVVTSWRATSTTATLDSVTYDTGSTTGAQLNTIVWQGSLPAGTEVRFQLAVSNSTSSAWTYAGPDGTSATYYTPAAGVTQKLDYTVHNGYRYFRYRVTLVSNQAQTLGPRVDDVVVGWSP